MFRIMPSGILAAVLAAMLVSGSIASAQEPKEVPAAPVPAQIVTAKKVFISNAGVSTDLATIFENIGVWQQPYDRFYAAMKDWARYELVGGPADADLVLEIRFGHPENDAPQLQVKVWDARTHFMLWTLAERVDAPLRMSTWDKNFSKSLTQLMDDLKKLAAPPVARAEDARK